MLSAALTTAGSLMLYEWKVRDDIVLAKQEYVQSERRTEFLRLHKEISDLDSKLSRYFMAQISLNRLKLKRDFYISAHALGYMDDATRKEFISPIANNYDSSVFSVDQSWSDVDTDMNYLSSAYSYNASEPIASFKNKYADIRPSQDVAYDEVYAFVRENFNKYDQPDGVFQSLQNEFTARINLNTLLDEKTNLINDLNSRLKSSYTDVQFSSRSRG